MNLSTEKVGKHTYRLFECALEPWCVPRGQLIKPNRIRVYTAVVTVRSESNIEAAFHVRKLEALNVKDESKSKKREVYEA